jgi:antirestriction protein ArdC
MQSSNSHAIYDRVTALVLETLESGVERWQKPWMVSRPMNAVTRRTYRGINVITLALTASARGFTSPGWVTYRAAIASGGHVKKGERGTTIVWWERVTANYVENTAATLEEPSDSVQRARWLTRTHTVFNLDQCGELEWLRAESHDRPPLEDPSAVWERIVAASGTRVKNDSDAAFYCPATDTIHMPAVQHFTSADAYSATLGHELIHSTGAPTRLNRTLSTRFGEEEYAAEELVAELGAAFLCGRLEIAQISQAAAYIKSWIRVLRNDARAIFTAARLAAQAADYLSPPEPEEATSENAEYSSRAIPSKALRDCCIRSSDF